jgi:hypothetical protein
MTDVTKKRDELVRLGNEMALYKLHGSVNWAWEWSSLAIAPIANTM